MLNISFTETFLEFHLYLWNSITSPDCRDRIMDVVSLRYSLGGAAAKGEASVSTMQNSKLDMRISRVKNTELHIEQQVPWSMMLYTCSLPEFIHPLFGFQAVCQTENRKKGLWIAWKAKQTGEQDCILKFTAPSIPIFHTLRRVSV